jgi:hypothetical protein
MRNWKTPRALGSALEVDRRKRPNLLYAPHVAELNKLVERIRVSKYGDTSVPWFDPTGAGINARVLMLLQDPSKVAKEGTGFISPDNPDKTADNTSYFRDKANLQPDELIHWNIVPWAINDRNSSLEINKAKPFLNEFIDLLPKLEIVVCMGDKAINGWNLSYPNNKCTSGWDLKQQYYPKNTLIALGCPHPSWQGAFGHHPLIDSLTAAEQIEKTLVNVRIILDRNSSTKSMNTKSNTIINEDLSIASNIKIIIDIIIQLQNSLLSGLQAFVIIDALRKKYTETKETREGIFISSLVSSSYNTIILSLSNFIKPNKDSINVKYLFKCIMDENPGIDSVSFSNLLEFIPIFESELININSTLQTVALIRDTTIAHLDKRHVTNPNALLAPNNPLWIDLERAFDITLSGLNEIRKYFDAIDYQGYISLSNLDLSNKTKWIFDCLYKEKSK